MKNIIPAIVIAISLTACSGGSKSSPTEPLSSSQQTSCAVGCDNVLHVPPQDQWQLAMMDMRNQVKSAVESGELEAKRTPDWNALPSVEWKACFFGVSNVSWVNSSGQTQVGSNCAAGLTDYSGGRIVISTFQPERTLSLVKWETANYFLLAIGRSDLTDRWQSGRA